MTILSRQLLLELERAVFEHGQGTVEEAAAEFSRDDLEQTIRDARQAMRVTLIELPATAFEQQPVGDDGEPEWSAGEIVGHITESMLWLQFALRRLAGENPEGEPADKPEIVVRGWDATHVLLDRADHELDQALLLAGAIADEPHSHIAGLGDMGVRGLLLLHAMHEWTHERQLAALGGLALSETRSNVD